MATYEQFKEFAKKHKLDGAGLYVVQPAASVQMPPLKVGKTTNLMRRLAQYKQYFPFGMQILGVARTRSENEAEKLLLATLGEDIQYKNEWIDARKKNKVMNSLATAHLLYNKNKRLGAELYTGDEIAAGLGTRRTTYELLPETRINSKTTPASFSLTAPPPVVRERKPRGTVIIDGVRRSARLNPS